jgi:hypothetical protein
MGGMRRPENQRVRPAISVAAFTCAKLAVTGDNFTQQY